MQATAQESGIQATRTITPDSVPSGGGEVTVTVNIVGMYGIGSVEETLPAGFSYVDDSVMPSDILATTDGQDGQKVNFPLVGESSFSYKVDARGTTGEHPFSDGKLVYGIDKTTVPVSGGSVTVEGAAPTAVTATRTIAPGSVPSGGGEVTVTVNIVGMYGIGSVEETLPAGFSYVDDSVMPSDILATTDGQDGQKVNFPLVGESSFSYKVDARGTTGEHPFSDGKLVYGIDKTTVPVSGGSVTVEGAAPTAVTATRTIAPGSVPSGGGEVTVTVNIVGMYGIGSVEETLPAGFSYVDASVTPPDITATTDEQDGQKVKFALVGESSFSYKVNTATANRSYMFEDGKLVYGIEKVTVPVSGGSVTVEGAAPTAVTATRTITPGSVPSGGGEVTVTVKIAGSYGIGSVEETLPPGFSYVDASVTPPDITATTDEQDGQKVKFALVGESSFSYKVNTATANHSYTFEGTLTYSVDKKTVQVRGTSRVRVGPTPTPASTPTPDSGRSSRSTPSNRPPVFDEGSETSRSIVENAPSGTAVGDAITASDSDDDDIEYSLIGVDRRAFDVGVDTGQITVAEGTSLDFESKSTYSVSMRASDPAGGRNTITVTIMIENMDEDGIVTLSPEQPEIGTTLTAMLSDPDGNISEVSWRWERSLDDTDWTLISGAEASTYTATEEDQGHYIRANAAFSDGHGSNKSAQAVASSGVPFVPTPTPAPTAAPTPVPTAAPTPVPTAGPTPAPTAAPTPVPTAAPTPAPTAAPTPAPTAAPTPAATAAPTPVAAAAPTPEPTAAPTPEPTAAPTPVATAAPTPVATPEPTAMPPVVEEAGGFPIWAIVLIVAALAVVVGGGALLVMKSGR